MTVQPSRESLSVSPDQDTLIARVQALVGGNEDEFARIMRIAGGEAGAADAQALVTMLSASRPNVAGISGQLALLRDTLAEAEPGVGRDALDARRDLDAAINWWGARLDDLLRH